MIAAVAMYDALETHPRQKVHELREQNLASIHRNLREKNPENLADGSLRVQVDTTPKIGNICVKSMHFEPKPSA